MCLLLTLLAVMVTPIVVGGEVTVELVAAGTSDTQVGAYERVVRDAMTVVLERRGFTVKNEQEAGPPAVLRYEYALVGFLPRLHVMVAVSDPQAGTRIAGALSAARGNITLYSSVDELLEVLDPPVDRYLARRDDPDGGLRPVVLVETILLPAGAGMEEGVRWEDRVSGTVLPGDYRVAQGATLPVRVSRSGHYPEEFFLPIDGARAQLPEVRLRPLRRFGAQLHYGHPRMIGAVLGGRYYALVDRLYVGGELGVHMSGFFGTTPSQLLHLDPRAMVGYVPLGARDRRIQPVFSSGIGLVATFVTYGDEAVPPYFDWYWNVANVAGEVGRGPVRWYARGGISYYFETERGLWEAGVNPDNLTPELVVGTVVRW